MIFSTSKKAKKLRFLCSSILLEGFSKFILHSTLSLLCILGLTLNSSYGQVDNGLGVVINEVMIGQNIYGPVSSDNYIEIVNANNVSSIDISNYEVYDGDNRRHSFGNNTVLPPLTALVLYDFPNSIFNNEDYYFGASIFVSDNFNIGSSNGGDDTIYLIENTSGGGGGGGGGGGSDPFCTQCTTIDQVPYDVTIDKVLVRDPDLTGAFVEHDQATRSNGAPFSLGTKQNGIAFSGPIAPENIQAYYNEDSTEVYINFEPNISEQARISDQSTHRLYFDGNLITDFADIFPNSLYFLENDCNNCSIEVATYDDIDGIESTKSAPVNPIGFIPQNFAAIKMEDGATLLSWTKEFSLNNALFEYELELESGSIILSGASTFNLQPGDVNNITISTKIKDLLPTFKSTPSMAVSSIDLPYPDVFYAERQENEEVTLSWEKPENLTLADEYYNYNVTHNGSFLTNALAGENRSYTENTSDKEVRNIYSISVNMQVASFTKTSTEIYSWDGNMGASTKEYNNRVKISWDNISTISEEIKVVRDDDEIAVVSKNATQYSDYDALPGFEHTYSISPIEGSKHYEPKPDIGVRTPNGLIKGEIKSRLGAGVGNVVVTATRLDVVPDGEDKTDTYSATTDPSGAYEIKEIYYHTGATFTITPEKGEHGFDPKSLERNLDLNNPISSNVNFTDTTVFSISGQILFNGGNCAVEGVDIFLDGAFTGIKTDKNGFYNISIQDEGVHSITPKFKHHDFTVPILELDVQDNITGQDFTNMETDSLLISLTGICGNRIAESATFTVNSTDQCYFDDFDTNASGNLILVLPSREYRVKLKSTDPVSSAITNYFVAAEPIIDLNARDSLETDGIQTSITPTLDFVYHEDVELSINDLPAPKCLNGSDPIVILEQGNQYSIAIEISEVYSFDGTSCHVDSGEITIFDDISDRPAVTVPIENGFAYYTINAGQPNIADSGDNPFQKLLEVEFDLGFGITESKQLWVIVDGVKPRVQTFVTKTPELPFFILHDPPGDNSYSYIEKDTSVSFDYSIQTGIDLKIGHYAEAYFGAGTDAPIVGEVGGGGVLKTEIFGGVEINTRATFTTSYTSTDRFATSDNENLTGSDGDVYVGGSYNVTYSLADVVGYDEETCTINLDTSLAWQPAGLATRYTYTEYHIKNILIPQLERLKELSTGDDRVDFSDNIKLWKEVIKKNKDNRDGFEALDNRSFSAGAPYENIYLTSKTEDVFIDFTMYIEANTISGLKVEGGSFNELETGSKMNMRWYVTGSTSRQLEISNTFGYFLDDNDIGDSFSVDIGEDPYMGSPIFRLEAGTSSCPHELGTQPRDTPQIKLNTNSIRNVPSDGKATFIASMSNLSQSEEAREYQILDVSSTNLDGAVITMGGTNITGLASSYFIPPGETITTTMTVERGPLAFDYEELQVIMYSPCEYSLWEDNGSLTNVDTVTFSVHYQSVCSTIDLYTPGDNWLVNASDNDILNIAFSGYDANNEYLKDIWLQYRKVNESWNTAVTVIDTLLVSQFHDYPFDVSNLDDGEYQLRAVANCGQGNGLTYSQILNGTIDRTSISPYGTFLPSNGFLRKGQDIKVSFNKEINCQANYTDEDIKLVRNDTGEDIPVTWQCLGNELLISTDPPELINSLDSLQLSAYLNNIEDLNDNKQNSALEWSFIVNVNPVFWETKTNSIEAILNTEVSKTFSLQNSAQTTQSFILTEYPEWILPKVLSGAILAENSFGIEFDFDTSMDPEYYSGSVTAEVDGTEIVMTVNLDLRPKPVGWGIDPEDFEYSMNLTAQFSLTGDDSPLSTSKRDVIGVFANGKPRGLAHIEYVKELDVYAAFITVYSNENDELLKFRMWDGTTGIEYGAKEELIFEINANVGSAVDPYLLHSEGVFQVIPFTQGWNWFSFNVMNSYMQDASLALNKLYESILSAEAGNNLFIKSQNEIAEYTKESGWNGNLTSFSNEGGFMIRLSDNPDTLRVIGTPITDLNSFDVDPGWNWISFPLGAETDVNQALNVTTSEAGDLVKSQFEFAEYNAATTSWVGNLKKMKPGLGYKLKLGSANAIDYPENGRVGPRKSGSINTRLYEYNMAVIVNLPIERETIAPNRYTVEAYINDELHGAAYLTYNTQLNKNLAYLMIHGNIIDVDQVITFKLFDAYTAFEEATEGEEVSFKIDRIVGSSLAPYVLEFNKILDIDDGEIMGYELFQNYPNPVKNNTIIEYTINTSEQVTITLYDQVGKKSLSFVDADKSAGRHKVNLGNLNLSPGIYFYRMQTPNFQSVKKMIIIK